MEALDFEKSPDGLIPAVAQDWQTGEILMLAYVNRQAWLAALETGEATYWSRSRQQLWRKGESSGNVQRIHAILIDCDGDAIIYQVEQLGGAACHTGHRSCFYRRLEDGELVTCGTPLFDPEKVYGSGR